MSGVGTTTINFGAAPGTNVVTTVVSVPTIAAGDYVEAYMMYEASSNHNAYEHMVVPIKLTCEVTAGSGFTIHAMTELRLSGVFTVRWAWLSAAFDPAQLAETGYWRASFSGTPWTPTGTVGSSISNGNLITGVAPSVGTAVNTYTPAVFNGSTAYLLAANPISTYLSSTASSAYALVNIASAPAPSGLPYTDPCILTSTTTSLRFILSYNSSGAQLTVYNGAYYSTTAVPLSTGAWHLVQCYWDGSATCGIRIDGDAWTTMAHAGPDTLAAMGNLQVGANYNASVFSSMSMLEVGTAMQAFSTAQFDNIRFYCNSKYGISV